MSNSIFFIFFLFILSLFSEAVCQIIPVMLQLVIVLYMHQTTPSPTSEGNWSYEKDYSHT